MEEEMKEMEEEIKEREEEMEEGTSHQKTRRILILKEPSSKN